MCISVSQYIPKKYSNQMVGAVLSSVVASSHFHIFWVHLGIPKQCGDEALTQLPERCHRLQCTCGSCSTLESSTLKPKTTKQKGKSRKSSAHQNSKSRSCVCEKTRKSSPLLPTARFVAKLGSCFRISRKTLKDRDAGDPSNALGQI